MIHVGLLESASTQSRTGGGGSMKNDWRRVLSYVVRWPLAAIGRWADTL